MPPISPEGDYYEEPERPHRPRGEVVIKCWHHLMERAVVDHQGIAQRTTTRRIALGIFEDPPAVYRALSTWPELFERVGPSGRHTYWKLSPRAAVLASRIYWSRSTGRRVPITDPPEHLMTKTRRADDERPLDDRWRDARPRRRSTTGVSDSRL